MTERPLRSPGLFSWDKYDAPCHHEVDIWYPKYDIVVEGQTEDIELIHREWICQMMSSPAVTHGVVSGPVQDPEVFVTRVELYLTAVQLTPVAIRLLLVHSGKRISGKNYDHSNTVYKRSADSSGPKLDNVGDLDHGFRKYMSNPDNPEKYFPAFCNALQNHKNLRRSVLDWMRLRDIPEYDATVSEAFRIFQHVVAAVDSDWPNDNVNQHKLMRKHTKEFNLNIPKEVALWLEKNKDRLMLKRYDWGSWYDAARHLRNCYQHPSLSDVETRTAMMAMSRNIHNNVCEFLWQKIIKAGTDLNNHSRLPRRREMLPHVDSTPSSR